LHPDGPPATDHLKGTTVDHTSIPDQPDTTDRPRPSFTFSISNTWRSVACLECGGGLSGPRPETTLEMEQAWQRGHDCDAGRVHDAGQAYELAVAGVGAGEGVWVAPDPYGIDDYYPEDDDVIDRPDTTEQAGVDVDTRIADVGQAREAAFAEQSVRANKLLADELAAGLCQLAAMVKASPEFAPLFSRMVTRLEDNHLQAVQGLGDNAAVLAAFARAALKHGAKITKSAGGDDGKYFDVTASWGPVTAKAWTMREQVCERVVTGVKTVTETVPDPEALAAVPTVEVTHEVETVDWVCKPLLAAETTAAGTAVSR
jgi:hypothetical protein